MMANQVSYATDQYKPDAHIGLFACDKTGPAEVMWYVSLQYDKNAERGTVPSVMMYAWSTVPGFCHLKDKRDEYLHQKLIDAGIVEDTHDIVTGFKVEAAVKAGLITTEEWEEILRHNVEHIGACLLYTSPSPRD